jgi:hypothetical protein
MARTKEGPTDATEQPELPVEQDELTLDELDQVSAGMKYERGTQNPNVIDARGGVVKVLGLTFTLDVNGKISSIT